MIIIPFDPSHLKHIKLQANQRNLLELVRQAEYAKQLQQAGESYAAVDEGRVLACAGLIEVWPGRYSVWAILGDDLGSKMVHIHKATLRILDNPKYRRVEATVDYDFDAGHRWVRMMGFVLEAPKMVNYTPDGRTASLYARVR